MVFAVSIFIHLKLERLIGEAPAKVNLVHFNLKI